MCTLVLQEKAETRIRVVNGKCACFFLFNWLCNALPYCQALEAQANNNSGSGAGDKPADGNGAAEDAKEPEAGGEDAKEPEDGAKEPEAGAEEKPDAPAEDAAATDE